MIVAKGSTKKGVDSSISGEMGEQSQAPAYVNNFSTERS